MLLATTEIGRIYFTLAANDSPAIPFYIETPVFVTITDLCMACWNETLGCIFLQQLNPAHYKSYM